MVTVPLLILGLYRPFSLSALQGCPWEEGLCEDQQWGCSHGHECIPDVWRCDGEPDCTDGTDEAGCHPAPCQSHEYPCGLGSCLNASLVCNGQQDCADGSDEGGNCSVPCQRSCTHLCYPSPQGPRCWCRPGYRLAEDGLSCRDINECMEWGKGPCSQTCLNAPGSYSCGCLPGYLLEPDGHICKLTGKVSHPSAASFLQVYLKDLPASAGSQGLPPHRALPLAKVSRLTAVDYAVKDKSLYFAEVGGNSIGLLRLKDWGRLSWKKAVAVEGTVTSLALDWLSGNLYWIGGQPPSIHVAAPRGRWALALLSEGLQGAAWLALCPRASTMCFVTAASGRGAMVECAAMDGTKLVVPDGAGAGSHEDLQPVLTGRWVWDCSSPGHLWGSAVPCGGRANQRCFGRHQWLCKEQRGLCPALPAQPGRAAVPLVCAGTALPRPAPALPRPPELHFQRAGL
uniref:EGF-like domain-containing protein n=1 Tax=Zosterops lateralis melanops TaxID=1220523 RepID=A0A8D2NLP4_ZOSLA